MSLLTSRLSSPQTGTQSVGDADERGSAVSLATGLHSLGSGPPRSISTSRVGVLLAAHLVPLTFARAQSRRKACRCVDSSCLDPNKSTHSFCTVQSAGSLATIGMHTLDSGSLCSLSTP